MYIEHIAIWCQDLERMRAFYEQYFGATSNSKYTNAQKNFESYFLSFQKGARLELMQMPTIPPHQNNVHSQFLGLIHMAISVGDETQVNLLTEQLRNDGYEIVGEPRHTGDGYYESVVLDPEQNRIEITA
ncbi:VOC family protein [Runella sp. MFBS21]|uniref:VOC family protein n=1 Tax=Runella sp. MFBS21 TaxID=3034018 RepID=UPI0023F958E8|nr:VOC family protein [Runella sp. MFBS21]MDF7821520.1 VOC family protein [Runella sp. MFBS21]